jgi:hypothetical protein
MAPKARLLTCGYMSWRLYPWSFVGLPLIRMWRPEAFTVRSPKRTVMLSTAAAAAPEATAAGLLAAAAAAAAAAVVVELGERTATVSVWSFGFASVGDHFECFPYVYPKPVLVN